MPTTTTNYSLYKPLVNDPTDQDQWGAQLNTNTDNIDVLLKTATDQVTATVSSSPYAVTTADRNKLILVNAGSSSITVNLVAAATAGAGFTVTFKKTDSSGNSVTIDGYLSETIDGTTTKTLTSQYQCYTIVCDGSNWFSISTPPVATFVKSIQSQLFLSSGTYTPTTGMLYCIVEGVGGGGGGGGTTTNYCAGGGGAGGYAQFLFSAATIGSSQTVTIGAAGSGGGGGVSGFNGGTTSLGSLMTANGGSGGSSVNGGGAVAAAAGGAGGSASSSSGLIINAFGASGSYGFVTSNITLGGAGGNSYMGGGGGQTVFSAGNAGSTFGAGGSGASSIGGSGGSGVQGAIWITEFLSV